MNPAARVRAFLAMSLDGFIAGDDDDLSWLPEPPYEDAGSAGALTWERFMDDVGALLMGRGTYDVVRSFDVEWPWGDRPVLVATHRELDEGAPEPVRRVEVESPAPQPPHLVGQLLGKDAGLLGGDHLGAAPAQPVDEALLHAGTQAVDVPRHDPHPGSPLDTRRAAAPSGLAAATGDGVLMIVCAPEDESCRDGTTRTPDAA